MAEFEEWTELRNNCTWTLTSNYNGTGRAGWIVTSNVSGYTDKSIFLPAAGSWVNTNRDNAGAKGYYWSSSLHTGFPYSAYSVYFTSDYVSHYDNIRTRGLSVRPVSE